MMFPPAAISVDVPISQSSYDTLSAIDIDGAGNLGDEVL